MIVLMFTLRTFAPDQLRVSLDKKTRFVTLKYFINWVVNHGETPPLTSYAIFHSPQKLKITSGTLALKLDQYKC